MGGEFVDALKTELESTFKEEISVYFDINPHDGLLETHDVNASLKDKLKCLVFIPIISHTYCDSKCFAWEHEFKAFIELATKDQFGLKVKLSGGNVANRVLPIQIHEIDADDKVHIERELGGILRPIEFIYKEPGVNKPLTSEDDEKKNLNNTKYRIQINKVANAIKEIIEGLKAEPVVSVKEINQRIEPLEGVRKESERKKLIIASMFHQKSKKRLILLFSVFFCIIGAYAILKFTGNRKQTQDLTNLEKTIAVLPFRNLSNDSTQLFFCDGFMDDILNNLQKVKSFTVRPRTSSYQYRDTKKSTAIIGKELNVNYLVGGSVGREGNNLKIRVSLTDSKADKQMWSNDYTPEMNQLFSLQSEKAFEIDPALPDAHLALGIYYFFGYLKYPEALKQFELVLKYQPKNPEVIYWSAAVHRRAGNWEMAKSEFEKALELNPGITDIADNAGLTFDLLRDYSKAEEFYNMSIMLHPDWVFTYIDLSQMYIRWEGDTRKAREILGNAERNNKASISDSVIIETNVLIDIYEGKYEKALKDISLFKYDVIQTPFYFRPKYLYNATIYGLMNKHELEHAYYDSARIFLEKRIIDFPEDHRLYSSLGIAYAGLGLEDKAIRAGEKAIKLLPVYYGNDHYCL